MNKIVEKIIEPSKIITGSFFKLKIKVIRYLTYQEVKNKTYHDIKNVTYKDLKGD